MARVSMHPWPFVTTAALGATSGNRRVLLCCCCVVVVVNMFANFHQLDNFTYNKDCVAVANVR